MSENCNCDGTSCGENCNQGCSHDNEDTCSHDEFRAEMNKMSNIRHVIGIVSGKGGVGKSLVTSLLATMFSRKGYKTAVLDADITGPSIPKMFGVTGRAEASEFGIFPVKTHSDISIMSINLLLDSEDAPVIFRGPLIAGTVKQFWTDVVWNDVDYMFIDMPPGTGDVPLTVFQTAGITTICPPSKRLRTSTILLLFWCITCAR